MLARMVLLALLALAGCPSSAPSPVSPSPPDADGAQAPCEAACARLGALGCPEGAGPSCAAVLGHVEADRLVRTASGAALTCSAVAAAPSVAAVRYLGLLCSDGGVP